MADREYTRLTRARRYTGRSFGLISAATSSLWLGKDHLLVIESNGYSEGYKRFYFKDLQALIIRKTQIWIIRALILAAVAVIFILIAVATRDTPPALYILGGVGVLFALALLYDVLAGPTASCSLRTAVQTEQLPSLNRLRRARKVLNRLRPLIAAAQGSMTAEEVSLRVHAGGTPVQSTAPSAETAGIPPRSVS